MKKLIAVLAVFLAMGASSFGADTGTGTNENKSNGTFTKEQREKMAQAHEKMASCLRSDKSLAACHDEMRKSCRDDMDGSCPMWGKMRGGRGMMRKGPMRGQGTE